MKIGTIGYSNASGLGVMLKFFRKHLEMDSQLVIDWEAKGMNLEDLGCKYVVTSKEYPSIETLEEFISFKPDVALIIEYPFCWDYLKILKEKGIKIVYIPMLDSVGLNVLELCKDFVDLWLCVTKHSYKLIQLKGWKCCYLPYPVDTNYFKFENRKLCEKNLTFLHNAGYCNPRKGTDLVFAAYLKLKEKIPNISLIVNSQVPMPFVEGPDIRIHNTKELSDLYRGGNIYLAPSRKEGLGLPIYEAMAYGFPVITTNAPPMNEVVTDERLLVKVENFGEGLFSIIGGIAFEPSLDNLVLKMEHIVNADLDAISKASRKVIEEKFSWNILKSEYLNVFQKVVDGKL